MAVSAFLGQVDIGLIPYKEFMTAISGTEFLQFYDPLAVPHFCSHHSGKLGGKRLWLDRHVNERKQIFRQQNAGFLTGQGGPYENGNLEAADPDSKG